MYLNDFRHNWKKFGFRKAFQWAGLSGLLRKVLLFILLVLALLYASSDYANSIRREQLSEVVSQGLEIAALRDIVALCVNDGARGVLKIGEEYFLCGISPLGSFASRKGS
jgi:hypothetical protein